MGENYRISELAKLAKCQVVTIRYYEKEGLLPDPMRSEGNFRIYENRHLKRLLFIRRCRSLDMALTEIRRLLDVMDNPTGDCSTVNRILEEHIGHVVERIRELQDLKLELCSLKNLCNDPRKAKDCGILNELGRERSGGDDRKREENGKSHLKGVHHRKDRHMN